LKLKEFVLAYTTSACLLRVGLRGFRIGNGINFVETESYAVRTSSENVEDIVITRNGIQHHKYTTDPRERHFVSKYSRVEDFLRKYVDQRIKWATTALVASSKEYKAALEVAQVSGKWKECLRMQDDMHKVILGNLTEKLEGALKGIPARLARVFLGY
jgi:hypothetical protein